MTPAPPESLMDAECTCPFVLGRDGSRFITSRNPQCVEHGDDTLDWRGYLEMSGRLDGPIPADPNPLWTDWFYQPNAEPHPAGYTQRNGPL